MPEGKIRKPQVIGSSPIVGSTYLAESVPFQSGL
jgi:hypothetical protein